MYIPSVSVNKMKLTARETVIFAMLGALMYASKMIMEVAPNIHLLGVMVIAMTVVYRWKALYPIYVFVFLSGMLNGFSMWWIPYLYIWTVLWAAVMLLPKQVNRKYRPLLYMSVCALHGFCYGILYAPVQALMFGLNIQGMIAWIVSGLPFDLIHGVSNFICGALIMPMIRTLRMAERSAEL